MTLFLGVLVALGDEPDRISYKHGVVHVGMDVGLGPSSSSRQEQFSGTTPALGAFGTKDRWRWRAGTEGGSWGLIYVHL